jgi:hypothetical protein
MIAPNVSVLEDGILFKFIETLSNKSFDNTTDWGFVVKDKTDDFKRPRWAVAEVLGPTVKHVQVGDYILIENLQWTNGLDYLGDKFWKTNESRVMMITQEKPTDLV